MKFLCIFKFEKTLFMKYSILSLLILFSSYVIGQNDQANPPKIGVKVPLNSSVEIKGVTIKFTEVVEDSRCPTNVSCIWAGRAIVKAEVTTNGKTNEKTLIFGATRPGEKENSNLYSSTEFAINGLALNPYPASENSGKIKNYVLVICEEKNK